jgi:cytochrome c556
LSTKITRLVVAMLALAACATAPPVQEMSDARQALRAAEAVGAAQRSPEPFLAARRLLQEAQTQLEAGAYHDARRHALDARAAAIQARERATKIPSKSPLSPSP